MGLRTGVVLVVVGAALVLGFRDGAGGADLTAVGWVCACAGVLSLALRLVLGRGRTGSTGSTWVDRHDGVPPGA